MFVDLKEILVLCVLASSAHAAMPWGHCHLGMTPDELSVHLSLFHGSEEPGDDSNDWHVHGAKIDFADPNSSVNAHSSLRDSRQLFGLTLPFHETPTGAGIGSSDLFATATSEPTLGRPSHPRAVLFKQLGAFLF